MSIRQVGSPEVAVDPALAEANKAATADKATASVYADAAAVAHSVDISTATFRALLQGLTAATTYSIANLALRGLARPDGGVGWDMWIAGTNAFPTLIVAAVLLTIRRSKGQTTFAAWSFVWPIALAALFNQLCGNFAFQMSLSRIGLAISVPICFASIICSGAIVGRYVLGDQVRIRTAIRYQSDDRRPLDAGSKVASNCLTRTMVRTSPKTLSIHPFPWHAVAGGSFCHWLEQQMSLRSTVHWHIKIRGTR